MQNILDYSLDELKQWMILNDESGFRAKQTYNWLYKKAWDFNEMKNLNNSTISKLNANFYVGIPKIIDKYLSKDGTIKYLLAYSDGNIVECVVMKYEYGNSICVSTQVGCRMGCKFCASTLEGRIRDLTAGEILSQILVAENDIEERISNIVLMGSGEPLDNYDNVIKFINLVNSPDGLNIGQRHITLSTCGIVPKIYELADLRYQITLAISLHSVEDIRRQSIMPIANKYSIEEILNACKYYYECTKRRITFEYALVKDVNDSDEDALMLCKLLKDILCHVNLIPINEIKEKSFKKSNNKSVERFLNIIKNNGIEATVRREMGSDINAACGQLRRSYIETQRYE
ncbi:23S rRNA m(2)A-2503 methyltransferase [Clostridium amylolyticum]|uniref:Probable dual-specificity RNA methyltransferase RlmN n=1 Tax=Clostridium amylolyticum TaxID=1121298 RepID=A0A1M6D5Q3_9CLOT|nr:23S rRNA (adenine(2503)-C(2))-methyltransferase RlmN [Clostridium amylolyticum]SHI68537.1 23S rRNA m(2)A-2503 methyltransferase [Clostridium amylolyticum]